MENPEKPQLSAEVEEALRKFREALDNPSTGIDLEVNGMVQHFGSKEKLRVFLEEQNDRNAR